MPDSIYQSSGFQRNSQWEFLMTIDVFLAVLFSALFQGGWNFFAKKSKADKTALLAVGWFLFGITTLPVALWFHPPSTFEWDWLNFILASGLIHGAYVCFLGWGYAVGEVSVVYPIARGLGVVGTTIAAVGMGLQELSVFGFIGVTAVVAGSFLIGAKEFRLGGNRLSFFIAILIALTICGYSIVDSLGASRVPVLIYLSAMDLLAPLFAAPVLLVKMPKAVSIVVRKHKLEAYLVAIAGTFAYAIVLWAYQRSPAAYVAALREFSVVVASGLGIFLLRESASQFKIFGIGLIVLGLAAIKLA